MCMTGLPRDCIYDIDLWFTISENTDSFYFYVQIF
jgi:hypothetical protein